MRIRAVTGAKNVTAIGRFMFNSSEVSTLTLKFQFSIVFLC